jgi:adenylate cyclase
VTDIFVSYASEDRERVRPLVDALEARGYEVWWDRQIGLGTSFDIEIERALDDSKCVIVVWSEHSVASEWVRNEAAEAHERGIFVPCRIDDVKPPLAYRRSQTADLLKWGGDPGSRQLDPLIEIVGRMIGDEGEPARITDDAGGSDEVAARPSIAVLPISNLSIGEDFRYLADGMTDEIITLLAADPNLGVVERHSAYSYGGQKQDTRRIADELGVRYVVEGTLRVAGSHVRMTVHLVDAEPNRQLWAKRFNEPLERIYDIQDEIVDGIVGAIEGEVYRAESERSRRGDPERLNAWGLVVRAKAELGRLGSSGFEQVIALCRRAIELNPDTPLALAMLGNALAMQARLAREPEANRSEALRNVESALAQAHDDPLVLTYAANALTWLGYGQRALELVQRSISLAPNIATSYGTLGYAFLMTGQLEKAIENTARAIAISPRDLSLGRWYTTKAVAHCELAQWEQARSTATMATDRMPEFAIAWRIKAKALCNLADVEGALLAARRAVELAAESWTEWVVLAEVLVAANEYDGAEQAARTASELRPDLWQPLVALAEALRLAGDESEAAAVTRRAKAIYPELSIQSASEIDVLGTVRRE